MTVSLQCGNEKNDPAKVPELVYSNDDSESWKIVEKDPYVYPMSLSNEETYAPIIFL